MSQFFKNLIIVLIFLAAKNTFAQQKYAPTFLWKITGNGLTKPSYIYGTIHLQDKALFNLGDSIYSAIEKTDGFSLEINPVEILDSLIKKIDENDESPLVKDLFKDEAYKKVMKQIEKKYKVKADKLTLKKLYKYSTNKFTETNPKEKMQTFMDMYLYNIAMRQSKTFAALENVSDQMGLMNNFTSDNIEKLINQDSILEINYADRLKSIYIKKDLTGLNKMLEKDYSASFNDIFLTKRNIKMVNRIDSICKMRTAFYAFGAAHLPGDSGIIKLLQNKGYNVEPIISSKDLKPEEYKYTAIERPWLKATDDDSLIIVEVPLEPSNMNRGAEINLKLCMDLTNNMFYGFGIKTLTEENIIVDSITTRMLKNYKQTGYEILSHKKITQNGYSGEEFIGRQNEKFIYRIRFLINDKKMAMQIFGVEDKKYLYEENSERFFKSIKFTGNTKNKAWVLFENKANAYAIDMPKKPVKSKKIDAGTDISIVDSYTSNDINDGTFYLVQTLMPRAGYFFQSDDEYYDGYKKQMEEQIGDTLLEFKKVLLNNMPGLRFAAKQKVDGEEIIMQGYIIEKGNGKHVLLAVSPAEKAYYPNVSAFFNSFKQLPYQKTIWQKTELKEEGIKMWLPAEIEKVEKDSTSNNDVTQYHAQDKNTWTSYFLDVETTSPYYWATNDSSFYRNVLNGYKGREDSVYKYTYDRIAQKASMLTKLSSTNLFKKINLYINGNKIYTHYSILPEEVINKEDELKYFSDFELNNKIPSIVFENKIKLLTDSLASSDSVTALKAFSALKDIDFVKSDLPYLHNALVKKYKWGNEYNYNSFNHSISNKILQLKDSSTIDFIANNYLNNKESVNDLQIIMAELLGYNTTKKSYAVLKDLLLKSAPKSENPYIFVNALSDSLLLTKELFPEITALYNQPIIGGGIMHVANKLLDSNIIDKQIALSNEKGILENANNQIKSVRKNKDTALFYSDETIKMLGRLNTKESNEILKKYFSISKMWDKKNALLELINNNIAVLPADILKIAADKDFRTDFYTELKNIKKENLFPKQYFTQQKFAEGYAYSYLIDDYELENPQLTFISEKISKVKGIEKRFFIYKVKNVYDGEVTYNLFIMGGFPKDLTKIDLKYDEQEYYFNEDFKQSTINEIYNNYIKELNARVPQQ